jgi:hypothetical protein
MKSFKQFAIDKEKKLDLFESIRDEILTKEDVAFREICEASLSRLWSQSRNSSFAILSAYRKNNTKQENVTRNRELRGDLNSKKLGPHSLIGHWRECSVTDSKGNPLEYNQCPKDKLVDVVERSYFVVPFSGMSDKEFKQIIFNAGKKYSQDAVILKIDGLNMFGVYDPRSGTQYAKFSSGVSMNQVAQGYSRHVKKQNVPFVFEGVEVPTAGALAKSGIRKDGFYW